MSPRPPGFLEKRFAERIGIVGHRAYVGGETAEHWYEIGKLQYHFLVSEGLRHDHKFLDIACGSLRLGQFLIPFLDAGCYFGIDGEEELVRGGLKAEFYHGVALKKAPKFSFNYDFDFGFIDGFDYAIAQSLFTHLTLGDIAKCFRNLAPAAHPGSRFYFTFFEGTSDANPVNSDPHRVWRYSEGELQDQAAQHGWTITIIGDWSHPRDQKMALAMRR